MLAPGQVSDAQVETLAAFAANGSLRCRAVRRVLEEKGPTWKVVAAKTRWTSTPRGNGTSVDKFGLFLLA